MEKDKSRIYAKNSKEYQQWETNSQLIVGAIIIGIIGTMIKSIIEGFPYIIGFIPVVLSGIVWFWGYIWWIIGLIVIYIFIESAAAKGTRVELRKFKEEGGFNVDISDED